MPSSQDALQSCKIKRAQAYVDAQSSSSRLESIPSIRLAFEIPYRQLFVFQNRRCPAKVENMSLALEPTARATPTQTTVMGATGWRVLGHFKS